MARKLPTDNRTAGAPPGSLHPVVMRRLLEVILYECRISIMAARQARLDWQEQTDVLWLDEIPKTGTMSGWMRNDREANEYDQKLRREGA
jgi:hypothetical protein